MSTLTGKDLNLVKPALTDDHKVTIGTDLPANFQKIDDEFTAHKADEMPHQLKDITTNKIYKYGIKQQDGHLIFAYQEVV